MMQRSLTPLGWLVLGEAVLLGSTPWWHPQPMVAGLGLAMALLLGAAWWLAGSALGGVSGGWLPVAHAVAGDEVETRVRLVGSAPALTVRAPRQGGRGNDAVRVAGVDGACELRWSWRFPRRGLVPVARPRLESAMPFGLVGCRRELGEPCEVLVLPAPARVRSRLAARLGAMAAAGQGTGPDGDEPERLRPWQRGDAMHAIHWRASARHDRLLVMQRVGGGSGRRLAVVLDRHLPQGAARQAFERRIAAASGIVAAYAQAGVAVELHAGGTPCGGAEAQARLATLSPEAAEPEQPPSGAAVVLTGRPQAACWQGLGGEVLVIGDDDLGSYFRFQPGTGRSA